MVWTKKLALATNSITKNKTQSTLEVPKAKKEKFSQKEIITVLIENIKPKEVLCFETNGWGGKYFINIESNPHYPARGKKYLITTEQAVDDKPDGHRVMLGDSDNAKQVAGWISNRKGVLYKSTD